MQTVGVFQAKAKLSQLIDDVNAGEDVTITRHGEPVARLVPVLGDAKVDRRELITGIKRLRKSWRLLKVDVRQLIDDGRD